MKDHVETGHVIKFDAFKLNSDQAMDFETWLKMHTNVHNFETCNFYQFYENRKIFVMGLIFEGSWNENHFVDPFLRVSREL